MTETLGPHDIDQHMNWCRRCGRPVMEIIWQDLAECDGLPGVIHHRYLEALMRVRAIFDPITDKLGLPRD